MPKLNWNDFDDEDSSLSSASEDLEPIPAIQKRVSAPTVLTTSKLKNACDEMSLKKLEKHENNDVWLYIPNSFYDQSDEVDSILQKNQTLKKNYRVKTIGWNVLTSKENGRIFIQKGYSDGNIFIKFIYSSRNEERSSNNDQRTNRLQKRVTYIEKNTKQTNNQKEEQISQETETRSEVKQSKDSLVEERKNDKFDKKKVKWVQKSKSMVSEESKTPLPSYQELQSPKKYEESHVQKTQEQYKSPNKLTQSIKSPKKYSEISQIKSPKRYKEKEKTVNTEQTTVTIEEDKPQKESISLQVRSVIKENQGLPEEPYKTEAKKEEVQAQGEDSDESIEKQQKKKKKKKSQKKNKQGKAEKGDQNNPFSYFMK